MISGAEGAADQVAEVDLPVVDRGGEDVVDVAVGAALEDGARVVGVGGLGHRHRDQAGDDELVVVEAVDLLDPAAEAEAEDDDEEQGGDDRRERRLGPEAQDAVALAAREPEEALPGACECAVVHPGHVSQLVNCPCQRGSGTSTFSADIGSNCDPRGTRSLAGRLRRGLEDLRPRPDRGAVRRGDLLPLPPGRQPDRGSRGRGRVLAGGGRPPRRLRAATSPEPSTPATPPSQSMATRRSPPASSTYRDRARAARSRGSTTTAS